VLAKAAPDDPVAAARLSAVTYLSLEAVRVTAVALLPVCPSLASALLARMGFSRGEITATDLRFGILDGQRLSTDRAPLFPKV
jgi:methionyl-tRNA synthetase